MYLVFKVVRFSIENGKETLSKGKYLFSFFLTVFKCEQVTSCLIFYLNSQIKPLEHVFY
jgi:hypothetical protein